MALMWPFKVPGVLVTHASSGCEQHVRPVAPLRGTYVVISFVTMRLSTSSACEVFKACVSAPCSRRCSAVALAASASA